MTMCYNIVDGILLRNEQKGCLYDLVNAKMK